MDWYPKYFDAYAEDTRHLSCLEHGAYNLLIDDYYRTRRPLPDHDAALANICRLPLSEWRKIAPVMRAFFRVKDGFLHHKRINAELDAQDRRAKSRSEKAQKAAVARHSKNNDIDATSTPQACSEHAQAMLGDATRTKTDTRTEDNKHHALTAREVVVAFDRMQEQVFNGARRPFPAGDDLVFAQRWVEAGLDLPTLEGLFLSKLQAKKSRGEPTIGSLKFFDQSVASIVSGKKSLAPMPRAAPKPKRGQAGDGLREMREQAEKLFGETK